MSLQVVIRTRVVGVYHIITTLSYTKGAFTNLNYVHLKTEGAASEGAQTDFKSKRCYQMTD